MIKLLRRLKETLFGGIAICFLMASLQAIFIFPASAQEKRVERDMDGDGKSDRVVHFDQREKRLRMEIDSNNDGRFDTRYEFNQGRLVRSARDTDGDDRVNICQTYRNDLPVEQKTDGDGRFDLKEIYDDRGKIIRSYEEPGEDGRFSLT
jgi:hypothetical protein